MLSLCSIFESCINQALRFDPRTQNRLETLFGKRVRILISDFNFCFEFIFLKEKIYCTQTLSDTYDVCIKGPLSAFLTLALTKKTEAAQSLGLIIEGDMETALAVKTFFLDLNIEWEEVLSGFVPDPIAHQTFNFIRKTREKQQEILQTLGLQLGFYFKEERNLLPSPLEVSLFLNEVDEVRESYDCLSAKLERLEPLIKSLSLEG